MVSTARTVFDHSHRARWRRLRRKDDTATADPLWYDTHVDPDSALITIGGTASDGNYVTTLTPVPSTLTAAIAVTTTRDTTPATNDNIATQHAADFNTAAAVGGTLHGIVKSASAAGAVVTVVFEPGARYRWVLSTSETTATGTITLTGPDDTFPITRVISPYRPDALSSGTGLEFVLVPVSSADVPLTDDTDMTVDVRVLEIVDRFLPNSQPNDAAQPVAVGRSAIYSAVPVGQIMRIAFNGGRVGFWLSAATNPVTSLDAVELWIKECVE